MNLAIIPARGGSVRIPGKNVKLFHGKPIIEYSIDAALASGVFGEIVVSTDDTTIAAVAEMRGASVFWRKPDDGTRGTQEVAREVLLGRCCVDYACVIYPTAPMLTAEDLMLAAALAQYRSYVVAVGSEPLRDTGWFYFGRASLFVSSAQLYSMHTGLYVVGGDRAIDINTQEDWTRAEGMYAKWRGL